jgi:hypothetical protein
MNMKTNELTRAALDWAVAKCEGEVTDFGSDGITVGFKLDGELKVLAKGWATSMSYCPSTNWAQGGSIIEREKISVCWEGTVWVATYFDDKLDGCWVGNKNGPTPLIAAMRCYCASVLGDEIEIPEELT